MEKEKEEDNEEEGEKDGKIDTETEIHYTIMQSMYNVLQIDFVIPLHFITCTEEIYNS